MRALALVALIAAGLFTALAVFWAVRGPMAPGMPPPGQPMGGAADPTPPVKGFAQGEEVQFIHTEASDRQVAEMLTMMMGPQVLVVASLADIPDRLLAAVYVFTSGITGEGPFGFQPDIFDAVPGEPGYTPLRRLNLVAWTDGAQPRVLRSAEEVQDAAGQGDVSIFGRPLRDAEMHHVLKAYVRRFGENPSKVR